MSLNPVDSQIRADRAFWLRFSGRLEEALAAIDEELGKSPYSPAWFWRVRGAILLDLGRFGESVEAVDRLPQKNHSAWLLLAAAYGHLGQHALATQALDAARKLRLSLSLQERIDFLPFAEPEGIGPLLE